MSEATHSHDHGDHGHDHGHDHDHGAHGHDAAAHEKHYIKVWGLLMILLVVSIAGPILADDVLHLEGLVRFIVVLVTAFGIAIVKAQQVVKHFMHLTLEPKFVAYITGTAVAFMMLFFFFVAPDVMKHAGRNWENEAAEDAVRRGMEAGGEHGAPEGTTTEPPGHEQPFEARLEFTTTCGPCHGTAGGGDGPTGVTLTPRPASFTEAVFWEQRDRAHIVKVIREGGPSVGRSVLMASFAMQFNPEQIEALADVVMSFRPEPEPEEIAQPEEPPVPLEPVPIPEAPSEPVVEAAPPTEPLTPEGITEAETARRAAFIAERLLPASR